VALLVLFLLLLVTNQESMVKVRVSFGYVPVKHSPLTSGSLQILRMIMLSLYLEMDFD
jgi:hypothetical protein